MSKWIYKKKKCWTSENCMQHWMNEPAIWIILEAYPVLEVKQVNDDETRVFLESWHEIWFFFCYLYTKDLPDIILLSCILLSGDRTFRLSMAIRAFFMLSTILYLMFPVHKGTKYKKVVHGERNETTSTMHSCRSSTESHWCVVCYTV